MRAVLLSIGDELLIGQVVNTNAAWLGERLGEAGVTVARTEVVGDASAEIGRALGRALDEDAADVVVVTGGLGPTHDDVTVAALAGFFGLPLGVDASVVEAVRARLAERGRPFTEPYRRFAEVPAGFEALPNPVGMAPGLWYEPVREGRTPFVVALPGVPYELQAIADAHVLPRLRARHYGAVLHHTFQTIGEGETRLAERIGDPGHLLADAQGVALSLAFLPGIGTVRVRLSARGPDVPRTERALSRAAARVRTALGERVFAEGETTLEAVLGGALVARGLTLAVAESCTGGAVAARITSVPGSSRYFRGGVVAYDNEVKERLLAVPAVLLAEHGAVSEPVAQAMAEGARRRLGTDVAVATTGVAGPGGGTAEKPVGTVWLARADAAGTHTARLQLTSDRVLNVAMAVTAALDLVRLGLLARVDL